MRSARVLDFPPDALILTFFIESLQVIILSTNYWNSRCFATNPTITIIGDRQMKWLENSLKAAAATNKKVIISGHIPAG